MNLNIYVFFAGNQLFNCRKRILEFKENILHLKNQTKRNHQELIRVLSRIKYGVRKNLSRNLGLCCFCFCFSFYSLCLEIQILRFLVWGHFSPINITKSVLVLLLWDTEKSGKRLWYTSSHLHLERGRPVVFSLWIVPLSMTHPRDAARNPSISSDSSLSSLGTSVPVTKQSCWLVDPHSSQSCLYFPITISTPRVRPPSRFIWMTTNMLLFFLSLHSGPHLSSL